VRYKMYQQPKFEQEQRLSEYCITCEEHKNIGLATCWTCFKYIDNCWKESGLELREWVEKVKPQQLYTSCTSCNWFGIPIFDGDAEEQCKQCQMNGTYEYGEYYTASKF
jgi:hypothetical protein